MSWAFYNSSGQLLSGQAGAWRFYDAAGAVIAFVGDHDHTTVAGDGGVLTNDQHDGYSDYSEIADPTNPSANELRFYAVDEQGYSALHLIDSSGHHVHLTNHFTCKVEEAGGITAGQAICISGSTGNVVQVSLAKADSRTTLPAIGLAADTGALNAFIRVDFNHHSVPFDTSAFTEGDSVYVSAATAGALTATPPTLPNFVQRVGIVTRSHAVNGEVLITPMEVNPALADGDYGDITVSSSGTVMTVDASAVDHGDLTGLADNDHPQYLLVADIDDAPVNGETSAPISSNWAFDHEAAADPHTGYQKESEEDAASGYAGLNASSRITKGAITTDDLIVNDATKGLVLKDTQGSPHYWRVTVDNTGALVTTDLGTSAP